MWVRLMDWMIADAEPLMPRVGSKGWGRARRAVTPAQPASPDGIAAIEAAKPHHVRHRLTGRVITLGTLRSMKEAAVSTPALSPSSQLGPTASRCSPMARRVTFSRGLG